MGFREDLPALGYYEEVEALARCCQRREQRGGNTNGLSCSGSWRIGSDAAFVTASHRRDNRHRAWIAKPSSVSPILAADMLSAVEALVAASECPKKAALVDGSLGRCRRSRLCDVGLLRVSSRRRRALAGERASDRAYDLLEPLFAERDAKVAALGTYARAEQVDADPVLPLEQHRGDVGRIVA